ncbi:nucleoside 2-deoxyribosyltransferase [Megamonas sp.]|uniref:nucleoside 2-deoxyribosyltransferase n=1 Tax=Megamonas sp. TaxID=2049033 RepID=UPI00258B5EE1|nr:nucleoside 2-deoxyribosyltransferase [Megamonas sp.]
MHKFKVGDKVKVKWSETNVKGRGTIISIDESDMLLPYEVELDPSEMAVYNPFTDDISWFEEDALEALDGLNVYLAGPFFSENQIEIVKDLNKSLQKNETVSNIFVPMEHQMNDGDLVEFTSPWAKAVAMNDYKNVRESDIVVAIVDFDGQDMDSGTAAEIGYAYAIGRPVFLYHAKNHDMMVNLMATEVAKAYFTNLEEIEKYDFIKADYKPFTGNYR